MPHGYHGNILHVDLTHAKCHIEHPDEAFYRKYMGGSALGLYYLLKFTPAGTSALDPENTLVIALSVITGAPVSGLSRVTVVARSPLSGAVGDSQAGGYFPAEMKFSGFDAVVIRGKAAKPMYLWLHHGEAELKPADHLWGLDTLTVETMLKQELSDHKVEVLQCGPAGENGVLYAALINAASRANGRTGMGAVMGSKNLKAIAVRGRQRPSLADRTQTMQIARYGAETFKESSVYGMGLLGTAGTVGWQNTCGGLPTHNWSSGIFDGWEAIDGRTIADTILKKRETCYACIVRCKRVVAAESEQFPLDPNYGGPEYESLSTFGSYCGVDDLLAVSHANQLCNQYGLDSISTGATIAWAMDCFEAGILTTKDTDGLELRFGNAAAMVAMVRKIVFREGFGDILAEGSARAAEHFGPQAAARVVTAKKLELPAHMPQVKPGLGLIYAVNPFGADHISSQHDSAYESYPDRMAEIGLTNPQPEDVLNEEKVRFALQTQYFNSAIDSLNVCNFVFGPAYQLYPVSKLVETIQAITGWDVDMAELLSLGERRLNMMRVFNARAGFTRADDMLPERLSQPLKGGPSDGKSVDLALLETAKDTYYKLAGWDAGSGNPCAEKLIALGLDWLVEE